MMSKLDHIDWGRTVTFNLRHHPACPCRCCLGNGAIEYSLRILPSHLRDRPWLAPTVLLYDDEIQSLLSLIENRLDASQMSKNIGNEGESVSFNLWRDESGQRFCEFSLRVTGRGVDDIFLVDGTELDSLAKRITEMNQRYVAALVRLAERQNRERILHSRMQGKTLDQVKDEARPANPYICEDEPDPMIVLLAAAFVVGPSIDRLVTLTGYPHDFVADISCRMHDSELWADGNVFVEHWFDEKLEWEESGLAGDCSVADGSMVARRSGEDETWTYEFSGQVRSPYAWTYEFSGQGGSSYAS